jgi:DNA-binding PadR family transcriptional regulator
MPTRPIDPAAFLPLHPLEFRILLVLVEAPAHGYRIVKTIEERETDLPSIYPGNLYRRIRDLVGKGLLEEVDPPSEAEVDPRRKYFSPTEAGRAVILAESRRLEALVREAAALGVLSAS